MAGPISSWQKNGENLPREDGVMVLLRPRRGAGGRALQVLRCLAAAEQRRGVEGPCVMDVSLGWRGVGAVAWKGGKDLEQALESAVWHSVSEPELLRCVG